MRREFRDPELAEADITVSEVRLSPDLKHAIAFISRLGRSDVEALLPALKRVAPWLRSQVAHGLPLRYAPELSFQPDAALDYAMKINRLMQRPDVARDLKVRGLQPRSEPEKIRRQVGDTTKSTWCSFCWVKLDH